MIKFIDFIKTLDMDAHVHIMITGNPPGTVFKGVLSDFPIGTYLDVKDKVADSVCATRIEEDIDGLVFLASPSHSIEAERLKKHGYQGLVMVWYEGIYPDDTSKK